MSAAPVKIENIHNRTRRVFGSPTFFAGDRQFFGKDRMNLFEAAIVRGK